MVSLPRLTQSPVFQLSKCWVMLSAEIGVVQQQITHHEPLFALELESRRFGCLGRCSTSRARGGAVAGLRGRHERLGSLAQRRVLVCLHVVSHLLQP